MDVNDIRPADLVRRQQHYIDQDVAWLLGKSDQFVEVACPCCGGSNSANQFTKNRFSYVICNSCMTTYVSPRPTADILSKFYAESANYAFWAKEMFPLTEKNRVRIFQKRVEIVEKLKKNFKPQATSLLEIGPGYGTFCRLYKDKNTNHTIKAVEPSPDLASVCRNSGIDVDETTIEDYAKNTQVKFDIAVCFEVIEHLFDPIDMLTSVGSILKDKGLFIFSCPNGMGFDLQVLGEKSETYDHEHLNYFNPSSVHRLLNRAGFDLLTVETPGDLDVSIVQREISNGICRLENDNFLRTIFSNKSEQLDGLFQEFLQKSNLSSNMFVTAIKR